MYVYALRVVFLNIFDKVWTVVAQWGIVKYDHYYLDEKKYFYNLVQAQGQLYLHFVN